MEIRFCYKHPDTISKYRCYYCKKDICAQCRRTYSHHYFCSQACHLKYVWREIKERLKPMRLYIVGFVNVVLVAVLVSMFLARRSAPPEFKIWEETGGRSSSPSSVIEVKHYFLKLDSVLSTQRPQQSSPFDGDFYLLSLDVEKGSIVNIWRNNWPIVSEIVPEKKKADFRIPLQYGENHIRYIVMDRSQKLVKAEAREIVHRNPRMEVLSRAIVRGNPQHPYLSLTFDGGSSNSGTREILQILEEHGIRTTLFLTGKFIETYPELVKRMIRDGHEIGNHTYNHPHLTTYRIDGKQRTAPTVDKRFVQHQLLKTDSLFFRLAGTHLAPYWRAPYGEYNRQILEWAAEVGYLQIRWTDGFDTMDWVENPDSPLYRTPAQIYQAILGSRGKRNSLNGVIVLMHLGTNRSQEPAYQILSQIITDVQAQGYAFVPISRLLKP